MYIFKILYDDDVFHVQRMALSFGDKSRFFSKATGVFNNHNFFRDVSKLLCKFQVFFFEIAILNLLTFFYVFRSRPFLYYVINVIRNVI